MRKFFFLSVTLVLCALHSTSSHALTAVCKSPTGRMLGLHGKIGSGRVVDEPDGMKDGLFTLVWKDDQRLAQIIRQGSGGGNPLIDMGIPVFKSEEQVSFLVTYPSAVWLYSLYWKPRVLLLTSHNNGLLVDSGGAIAKSFMAYCEISEK